MCVIGSQECKSMQESTGITPRSDSRPSKRGRRLNVSALPNLSEMPLAKEFQFLSLYQSPTSPIRGDVGACSKQVGWKDGRTGAGIIKKYKGISLDKAFTELGVDKLYCALKLKEEIDNPKAGVNRIAAIRLRLACAGEVLESARPTAQIVNTGPVMVIVGATNERMRALKSGGRDGEEADVRVIDAEPIESHHEDAVEAR